MLKTILVVTFSVLNLGPIETAYREHLAYETVESGIISQELAAAWDTPATAGRSYLLMQPASEAPVYLRFVVGPQVEGYAPMRTFGWNATELLVTDPDKLADQLVDEAFRIVGPPKDLWAAPDAPRAMQVIGPGNELLYLTRNGNFVTNTFVDRVFIMVVGGPSMAAFRDFYGKEMGLPIGAATPFKIGVISRALDLPADTTYPLAVANISRQFLIELDEYPAAAVSRPVADDSLPPGTAMVTFEVEDLDALALTWRAPPKAVAGFPYAGRRTAVTQGPAGEWIELVEMKPPQD